MTQLLKAPRMLARPTCSGIEYAQSLVERAPRIRTGRALDPLADLDEISRVDSVASAAEFWIRARPRSAELLRVARERDLRLDARAVAIVLEANPAIDCEAGRKLKAAVLALLAGVMTAYDPKAARQRRKVG